MLAGSSFLGSEDVALHFGVVAGADGSVGPASATVRWREGCVELFTELRPDATTLLRRGSGAPLPEGTR